jgi:hypothetical protein
MGRSNATADGDRVGVEGRAWLDVMGLGPYPPEAGFGGAIGFSLGAAVGSGWVIVTLALIGLVGGWVFGVRRPGVPFTHVSVPAASVLPGCWMAVRGHRLVRVARVEEDRATLRYRLVGEDGSCQWSSRRGTVALARLLRAIEAR